jgi:ribosomal 50S subunit-associated protein YjgA (DUF615 family)
MAQVAGQVVDASLDLLEQVRDVFIVKGEAATQQRIQDNTTAPHVNLRASVQLAADHLQQQRVTRSMQAAMSCTAMYKELEDSC